MIAKGNNSGNGVLEDHTHINEQHEYITGVDESAAITTDDDDGGDSIAYVDDYEIAGNSDDTDGDAFFVEYVTEDDDNNLTMTAATAATVSGDSNDSEIDGQQQQLVEYDDDGGGESDEMAGDLYNCSTCGMNFKSVTEHIEKHHPEQDVLIDISDESGATAIKTERTLHLNDDDDDNVELDLDDDDGGGGSGGGGGIGSNAVGMIDGELIVYGGADDDELIDDELIEDVFEETDDSIVYTYDNTTGQITRATAANCGSKRITSKIGGANKSSVR